jgi:hypothetical protein
VTIGNNGSVKGIRSAVVINGQANLGVVVDDSQSTSRDDVLIANGKSGDVQVNGAFFGHGGSLDCSGVASLTLNLSHAAHDAVHLSASAVTAFFINADPSEYQCGLGALLNIDLDGATDDVLTDNGGAGTCTFTKLSHKTITFANMAKVLTH